MLTKNQVIKQLKEVIDPELNVNIVDLGLIYAIEIKPPKEILKKKMLKPFGPTQDEQVQHDKEKAQAYGSESLQARRDDKKKKEYDVNITMTLTSPGCPLSEMFDVWVRDSVKKIKGVKRVTIDLVWEPMWTPEKIALEVRESLGVL